MNEAPAARYRIYAVKPASSRDQLFITLVIAEGLKLLLLLSLWIPMTLCYSYGRSMSSASRLILLYDFLPQGEGGRLPASCSDSTDRFNPGRWCCANGTRFYLISFFICLFFLFLNQSISTLPFILPSFIQFLFYSVLFYSSSQLELKDRPFSTSALQMCSWAHSWPP